MPPCRAIRSMMLPLDAEPVVVHAVEIEARPAIADEHLDPVLVHLGVHVDLVAPECLAALTMASRAARTRADQRLGRCRSRRPRPPRPVRHARPRPRRRPWSAPPSGSCSAFSLAVQPGAQLPLLAPGELLDGLAGRRPGAGSAPGSAARSRAGGRPCRLGRRPGPSRPGPRSARCASGAATAPARRQAGQGQHGHGHHLGQLLRSGSAGRPPGRTPRRPGRDRRSPGPAPASRPGPRTAPARPGRRPRPATAAARLVSACRQTRAAPAQANATGQKSCWLSPEPLVCTIHSSPVPSATRASDRAPVDPARRGFVAAAADRAARRLQPGGGGRLGSRRQQQPERAVREHAEELDASAADEADPDHHDRPAEVPRQTGADATEEGALADPGGAGSVRLLPSAPGPVASPGAFRVSSVAAPMAGRSDGVGARRCAPKPVVDMMPHSLTPTGPQTSRVTPERTPRGVVRRRRRLPSVPAGARR